MSTATKSACCVPECQTCQPFRVAHWACAQCGSGPYRFDKTDAGTYKVLRPAFERTTQSYDGQRWHYDVRRICSQGCWQKEARRVQGEQVELAQRRPDLSPAILSKEQAEEGSLQQDDLDRITAENHDAQMHPQTGSF